jgi:hypothetical protein
VKIAQKLSKIGENRRESPKIVIPTLTLAFSRLHFSRFSIIVAENRRFCHFLRQNIFAAKKKFSDFFWISADWLTGGSAIKSTLKKREGEKIKVENFGRKKTVWVSRLKKIPFIGFPRLKVFVE